MKENNFLDCIFVPSEGLVLEKRGPFFWGKNSEGEIVYGIESQNEKLTPLKQSTKYLKISLNTPYNVSIGNKEEIKNLSLIMLKKEGIQFQDEFFRLTFSIDKKMNDKELLSYFMNLKSLFSNEQKKSIKELQGLYGELYVLVYLKEKQNIDLSSYYQTEDKRKFDFSLSGNKKIEVKTTTMPIRMHHFKLEQLNVLRYDIVVASLMLQKDDKGLSLFELVRNAKKLFCDNLPFIIHIEKSIKNVDEEISRTISYNRNYLNDNIRFVRGVNIPRLKEKTSEGIFNVEFDADMSSCDFLGLNQLLDWIK